jgi:anthranilate 1,2-dioxygenase small subunit
MDSGIATIGEETRRAVEDMIYAVAHAIDDDRLEEFPDFFTEQAVYRVASRFNVERNLPMAQINCTSRGMIADRIASLRHANIYQKQRYRHLISGIQVSSGEDRSLVAKSSYLVVRIMDDGTSTIFSSGEYRDRIVVENGKPRLSERLVIFDSKVIETLLVIPL